MCHLQMTGLERSFQNAMYDDDDDICDIAGEDGCLALAL